jgi:hypothetical protein
VGAAESGSDLVPHIEALTRQFGFDSFTYTASTCLHPDQEIRLFEFTTLPAVWAIRYDQRAYVEYDPRVIGTWDRTGPMLWDQSIARTGNSKVDAFLDDALTQGIASGVRMPLYDEIGTRILVDFDSSLPILEVGAKSKFVARWAHVYLRQIFS